MLGYAIAEAPIGAAPASVAQAGAVRADFPAAYAILVAAPVATAVRADFAAAYAILVATSVAVRADFAAAYAIQSEVIMAFTRSSARTIEILPAGAPFAAPAVSFWAMNDPKKPKGPKDPDSTIDISFDWRKYLTDMGDAIASHNIVLGDGLVDVGSQSTDGIVTVFVSGGVLATSVPVTCRITTASSPARVEDRTVYLAIESR